ncbi:hypothetical protein DMC47_30685 [Nostoc sp. 3335mG]|nr:hypothetical protein DMC47_30685 [Nostoc sp. 3335mG]
MLVKRSGLRDLVRDFGFARLPAARTFEFLGPIDAGAWALFLRSWDDLAPDLYMADGGRYRRRRHATFDVAGGRVLRKPHQPHFQSRDYNPLNGDIQRWFEPVAKDIADGPVVQSIIRQCTQLFASISDHAVGQPWHVEVHQFRIVASTGAEGRPTPEGRHRDGVDWVFVMLANRINVTAGVTKVSAPDKQTLGQFTLENVGDAVVLDDRRVLHGVTPITPVDASLPSYRDALVVTFVAEEARA